MGVSRNYILNSSRGKGQSDVIYSFVMQNKETLQIHRETKPLKASFTTTGILKRAIRLIYSYGPHKVSNLFESLKLISDSEIRHSHFDQFKAAYPPIDREFDPSTELLTISRLPQIEKESALSNYKSKLIRQRHALAHCRTIIHDWVLHGSQNPSELSVIAQRYAETYGFSHQQLVYIEDSIRHIKRQSHWSSHLANSVEPENTLNALTEQSNRYTVVRVKQNGPLLELFLSKEDFEQFIADDGQLSPQSTQAVFIVYPYGQLGERIAFTLLRETASLKDILHEREHLSWWLMFNSRDRDLRPVTIPARWRQQLDSYEESSEDQETLLKEILRKIARNGIALIYEEFVAHLSEFLRAHSDGKIDTDIFVDQLLSEEYDPFFHIENMYLYQSYPELYNSLLKEKLVDVLRDAVLAIKKLIEESNMNPRHALSLLSLSPLQKWSREVELYLWYENECR